MVPTCLINIYSLLLLRPSSVKLSLLMNLSRVAAPNLILAPTQPPTPLQGLPLLTY